MLRLYYSGGLQVGQLQNNPDLSLGGFMSATPLPNDSFDALFGTISEKGLSEKLSDTKAIFVRNEGEVTITDITLACVLPEHALCKFEFSPVAVPNQKYMERIPNIRSAPFYAEFFESNDQENPEVLLESLAAGEIFGLWVRRTIIGRDPIPLDITSFPDWLAQIEEKVENVQILFGWTAPTTP